MGGWYRIINSRVISLWNFFIFSLTTNPHLCFTLEEFWLKLLPFFLFDHSQIRTPTLHVTSHVTFFQSSSTCRVESIEHLFEVFPSCNFTKCQTTVVSARDVACDFFLFTLSIPSINLKVLFALGWSLYMEILTKKKKV